MRGWGGSPSPSCQLQVARCRGSGGTGLRMLQRLRWLSLNPIFSVDFKTPVSHRVCEGSELLKDAPEIRSFMLSTEWPANSLLVPSIFGRFSNAPPPPRSNKKVGERESQNGPAVERRLCCTAPDQTRCRSDLRGTPLLRPLPRRVREAHAQSSEAAKRPPQRPGPLRSKAVPPCGSR